VRKTALRSKSPEVVGEAVSVIRRLLQNDIGTYVKTLRNLGKLLCSGKIEAPVARAGVVWLVGEYSDLVADLALESLRLLTRQFPDEPCEVKLQSLTLALKLDARSSNSSKSLLDGEAVAHSQYRKFLDHMLKMALWITC